MPERSWLALERFEYSPLAGRWAVVRMRAALESEFQVPACARLLISRGPSVSSHGTFVNAADRRSREVGAELVWLASFAVPLEIVEYPQALFELLTPARPVCVLPAPAALALDEPASCEVSDRRWLPARTRRRVGALATAVAVSTASIPATGLAAAQTPHAIVQQTVATPADQSTPPPADTGDTTPPANDPGTTTPPSNDPGTTTPPSNDPGTTTPPSNDPGTTTPPSNDPGTTTPPTDQGTTPPTDSGTTTPPGGQSTTPPADQSTTPPTDQTATAPLSPATSSPQPLAHVPAPAPAALTQHGAAGSRHQHADRQIATKPATADHRSGSDATTPPARPSAPSPISAPAPSQPKSAPTNVNPDPDEATELDEATTGTTVGAGTTDSSSTGTSGSGSTISTIPPASLLVGGDNPPPVLIPIYKQAAKRYDVPWAVLAAINSIESDYGRDLSVSSAGAVGWMQFMPDTWREYGVDANHDGTADPNNPTDAIFAAARYLQASGAQHDLRGAIFAYNHATWYVDEVLARARSIEANSATDVTGGDVQGKLTAMTTMANTLLGLPYVWGGGHTNWDAVPGYDCSGFVSAVLHAGGYLSAPQTTDTLPSQPGIQPGPGRYVTIYDRANSGGDSHVIIDLNGTFYESGGSAADGGGAGVKKMDPPAADYLSSFNTILHPAGL
jgi:soluble lytic murein transglycosylase-like protein